ncbi:DNA-binding protein [Paraburkholderia xenovorans]|uniref:SLOG cluster 4 domain-containing protein n=1 Tax=Paraburkholderia xenovorans TaxID=36873 RepID=UPI0038BB825B
MKLNTIGVMGSGQQPWRELAEPLGEWIARAGHNLLTGGGRGVMSEVSRAFTDVKNRAGRAIGIVPTRTDEATGFVVLEGYPNPYVEVSIVTPLPRREPGQSVDAINRNHVNVLSSDVIVALPGGLGTAQEIEIALRWGKPVVCFGTHEALARLPAGAPRVSTLEEVKNFVNNLL